MEAEKRLYDLLIMVYRSPELMIRMTGSKQKYADDDRRGRIQNAGGPSLQVGAPDANSPKDK